MATDQSSTHRARNDQLRASGLFDVSHVAAVVTGGGTGIGLMIAQALAANGARVYITGRRPDVLAQTAERYGSPSDAAAGAEKNGAGSSGRLIPLPGDVSKKDEAIRLAAEVARHEPGGIQLLVNNAGVARDGDTMYSSAGQPDMKDAEAMSKHFLQSREDQWLETMQTNVAGAYFMAMAFLPLLARGGSTAGLPSQVVNVSSISGAMKGPSMGQPAYATSKAAATHLSRVLASLFKDVEGGPVRVNVIAPGLFPSEMTAGESGDDNKSELSGFKPTNPAARTGRDSDMAATILFLAGKGGSFYNGQILYPDGGNTIVQPAVNN